MRSGRKTYHHLTVATFVVVERIEWDSTAHDIKVVDQISTRRVVEAEGNTMGQYTYAHVVHVGAKQVKITVDWKDTGGSHQPTPR